MAAAEEDPIEQRASSLVADAAPSQEQVLEDLASSTPDETHSVAIIDDRSAPTGTTVDTSALPEVAAEQPTTDPSSAPAILSPSITQHVAAGSEPVEATSTPSTEEDRTPTVDPMVDLPTDTSAHVALVLHQDTLPTDSAVVPPAPGLLPSIDPRAPWEISLWAGAFNTDVRYSGTRTSDWHSTVQAGSSTGFGAEIMHMGQRFGVGSGVHFNTYTERFDAQELSTSESVLLDSNYFLPVDTTLLHVVGLVEINGQQYYVTEQHDTTINVLILRSVLDTRTSIQREARRRTNTLSYIEVPLLGDVHWVEGPWMLGLRAGPTLGMLQGRRGFLPNAGLDGYTDLEDEAFRTLVIGYSARAYVRYRIGDAWAVGLEPGIRGQLIDGLDNTSLSRRSTAWGGALSITYRLP
jgi:hypothetical protein